MENAEGEIEGLEAKLKEMEVKIANGASLNDKDFFTEYESIKKKIESLLPKWERLQY